MALTDKIWEIKGRNRCKATAHSCNLLTPSYAMNCLMQTLEGVLTHAVSCISRFPIFGLLLWITCKVAIHIFSGHLGTSSKGPTLIRHDIQLYQNIQRPVRHQSEVHCVRRLRLLSILCSNMFMLYLGSIREHE